MPVSSMNVRTNVATMEAHRNLRNVTADQSTAQRRLTSGKRITSAADDAAGVAISESMTTQIRGLDQASANAQDAVGLLQTAEGALEGVANMLHRIKELMVQAANDTNNYVPDEGGSRSHIQREIDQLLTEINEMSLRSEYNTKNLLSGDFEDEANALFFQIGANSGQGMSVTIGGMTTARLAQEHFGAGPGHDLLFGAAGPPTPSSGPGGGRLWVGAGADANSISALIQAVDDALEFATRERAKLGAAQVRIEHARVANDAVSEYLSEARSRIRDADMAREMMDFTQMNILFNVGIAMIAQGNQLPNNVMQLLQ